MIMGRNKRKAFQGNGANSDTDTAFVSKKKKELEPEPEAKSMKYNKKHRSQGLMNSSEKDPKRNKKKNCTDTSSSSESDSERNSVKKSERSVTDSNSESGSDSYSDSLSSESSRASKPVPPETGVKVKNSVTNLNPVPIGKVYRETTPRTSGSDSYHSDTEEEDKKRRKKQKEIIKQQLTKKGKRASPRKQETLVPQKEETEETEEEDPPAAGADDILDWPESDILELIRRMEVQIPEGDTQKFDSRAARLNWDKIAFGNYSKQECHDTWNQISKRIRRFRKLSEILEDAKEWAKKPWTNFYRGSKKNRHPDMPIKPLSAYMMYYQEHKEKVMEENKGADMMQISKIMTEMYKNLSDKEREKYSQRAAREKQLFEEKMAEFYKDHPEMGPPPSATTQTKTNARESGKGPKKPHPPFKLFFQEELKNVSVESLVDKKLVEESAREKWRNFSDKKKAEYIKMSLEELNQFEREVKAFKQQHPEYSPNYNKNILNKEERLILERLSGKPVKPPNSAYSLFSRYMLQSNSEVKSKAPKLRMAEISKKWKELSAPEKHKYELNVKELQEDYKSKLQQYLESLTPEERERELDSVKKEKKKKEKTTGKKLKSPETKLDKVEGSDYELFPGEPKPPPMEVYDLFVEKFLADRPPGISEETRLQQAPEHWEKLPDSKKEALREELDFLKQKYVTDFGGFLKKLSAEQLKVLSLRKAKAQKEVQQMQQINGTLSDSNDESDEERYESSSDGSDSDDSESVKSKKNGSDSKSSSSDDSDG